jgi:hypothetical protein
MPISSLDGCFHGFSTAIPSSLVDSEAEFWHQLTAGELVCAVDCESRRHGEEAGGETNDGQPVLIKIQSCLEPLRSDDDAGFRNRCRIKGSI